MSELINELPNTYQTPTMAPFCKDEEKYQVVDDLVNQIEEIKNNKTNSNDLPSSVLFICNFNTIRSPIAEAIAKYHCNNKIYIDSAGVAEKIGKVNPFAVSIMEEVGIDIARHKTKKLEGLINTSFELIIALSSEAYKEVQELAKGNSVMIEYWQIKDPTEISGNRETIMSAFRDLREELYENIKLRLSN